MPSDPAFGVEAIRELARQRANETSIRAVADELGMSPSGLHVFLQGSRPHPATRAKLVAWYAEYRRRSGTRVHVDDVELAIELLARSLSEESRDTVRARRFDEIVQRLAAKVKVPPR